MSRRARFVLVATLAYLFLIVVCLGNAFDALVMPSPMFVVWFAGAAILTKRFAVLWGRWIKLEAN